MSLFVLFLNKGYARWLFYWNLQGKIFKVLGSLTCLYYYHQKKWANKQVHFSWEISFWSFFHTLIKNVFYSFMLTLTNNQHLVWNSLSDKEVKPFYIHKSTLHRALKIAIKHEMIWRSWKQHHTVNIFVMWCDVMLCVCLCEFIGEHCGLQVQFWSLGNQL